MIHQSEAIDLEMQRLARRKNVVVRRSPHSIRCGATTGYYVCDGNDFLLFPLRQLANHRGATAEETMQWLLKA